MYLASSGTLEMRLRILILLLFAPLAAEAAEYGDPLSEWRSAAPAYLDEDLRRQVDALRIELDGNPTDTVAELDARAALLWRWANAYALSGRPINPNLPQEIARLNQAPTRPAQVPDYGPVFDDYVREFAFRDAFPDAIGTLESVNPGPHKADGFAELVQVHTVGEHPIGPGGGFVVATRDHLGSFEFQTADPSADNWLNVISSNPDVEFTLDERPISGMFSGVALGAQYAPRPFFRVSRGVLGPGDEVYIVLGDRSGGSRGMKLPSAASSGLRVRVWLALDESGPLFSLDEAPFHSEGLDMAAMRGFGPSIVLPGENVLLSVRAEDRFRNRASAGMIPFMVTDGDRPVFMVTDTASAYHETGHHIFDEPGVYRLEIRSLGGDVLGHFNPILVTGEATDRIYWGETHGHTGFAEGSGTVENFFRFAREDARLDFMTLSEHDIWMDDFEWEALRSAVLAENVPGRFLTYLGYEWTRPPQLGGHHNVLFRTAAGRRRVEAQRAHEIPMLYTILQQENAAGDVLVIPHAHNPGRWWESDPNVEHLVEIVSNHGTFEWLGQAFLREGHHLGFVGGSDDHVGHPGIRPLNNARPGSDNFGGMAAVIAPELDSDLLFDAMKQRRTYATNGQKIILLAGANGSHVGSEIGPGGGVEISGEAIGTGAIASIELIKNGEVFAAEDYMAASAAEGGKLELRFFSESDPLQRDLRARGHRIWRGSLRFEGVAPLSVTTPDVENTFTEYARVNANDASRVDFFIRTRGAPRTILVELPDLAGGEILGLGIGAGPDASRETIDLANLAGETIVSQREEYADELRVRWVREPVETERGFQFVDDAPRPGDSYYLRVTQLNGGMAWSSPWVVTP